MKPTGTILIIEPKPIRTDDDVARDAGLIVSEIQPPKHKRPVEEFAEVIAVGPGVKVAKAGDTVYYKDYNADRIYTTEEELHVFIEERFILAVKKK